MYLSGNNPGYFWVIAGMKITIKVTFYGAVTRIVADIAWGPMQ